MPLAVTEVNDTTFLVYVGALAVSGLVLAILAIGGFGLSVGLRLLNGLFALGFLGYAVYLYFIFEGGEFRMFWYAFVLPVVLIIQAIRGRKAKAGAEA
jgi:hypothetical protein